MEPKGHPEVAVQEELPAEETRTLLELQETTAMEEMEVLAELVQDLLVAQVEHQKVLREQHLVVAEPVVVILTVAQAPLEEC